MAEIIVLCMASSVLFALSGVVVRIQLALFRGFDFTVAASVLIASEAFTYAASILGRSIGGSTALGLLASLLSACALFTTWNCLYSTARNNASSFNVFIVSLGISTALMGLVGLIRGPGLRQSPTVSLSTATAASFAGIDVGVPSIYMIVLGSVALVVIFAWLRTKSGFALSLLAQNLQFASELGIERRKIAPICGLISGVLSGLIGSYIAYSSGSTLNIGSSIFLYGAGSALLWPGPTIVSSLIGGTLLGSAFVMVQLIASPSWAAAIIFAAVIGVILLRGTSRTAQGVR